MERRVKGTAGDTVRIEGIILVFQTGSGIQWDISLGEMPAVTKGIAGQKKLIEFYGIKGRITKEGFGIDQWVL